MRDNALYSVFFSWLSNMKDKPLFRGYVGFIQFFDSVQETVT